MTDDPVIEGFRETAAAAVPEINAATDRLRISADPLSGAPPCVYHLLFDAVTHFERAPAGGARIVTGPVAATLRIPDDYLRSGDGSLQFRVASVEPRIVHPNCRAGVVCLGPRFAPGTKLRPLVEQLYDILASRVFASDHGFDAEACRVYLANLERVKAIRAAAPPLWRRPLAAGVRVRELPAPASEAGR
jgi:hypothetical protein